MKLNRKLMRDFAKVVLPGYVLQSNRCLFVKGLLGYDLMEWQTVIELAQKWSEDGLVLQHLPSKKWRVFIGFHPINIGENDHGDLPTAIMKAVVAAAKSEEK
jgi:hypothetical protein